MKTRYDVVLILEASDTEPMSLDRALYLLKKVPGIEVVEPGYGAKSFALLIKVND